MAGPRPIFLPTPGGTRFCMRHAGQGDRRGAFVYVHPLAEEMNKSRRMAALQARAFADEGYDVLQIDLAGCGDSDGEFGDATWDAWVADTLFALDWLQAETGHLPALWALRHGALVAVEALRLRQPGPNLVLWQPVHNGRQALQQFLRLRLTRQFMAADAGQRGGMRELRAELDRDGSVEVGGYALGERLAAGLEAATLDPPPVAAHLAWLEVAAADGEDVSPASRARLEAWSGSGWQVQQATVVGPAFWQTPETAECESLVPATLAAVAGWRT